MASSEAVGGGAARPSDPLLEPLHSSPLIKSLPLSFTTVRDVYWPSPRPDRLFVLIQDVHDNTEAQENISRSLEHMAGSLVSSPARTAGGSTLLVGVEGAVIQLYCTGPAPDCVDRFAPSTELARPLAETTSGPDGDYRLIVPDPGTGT